MVSTISEPTLPSDYEAGLAREATRVLEAQASAGENLRLQVAAIGKESSALDLPTAAAAPLLAILKAMGEGKQVTVQTAGKELTAQQAADLLNVSPPYLASLVDTGVLPARMAGDQLLLPMKDVLAHLHDTRVKRRAALDELANLDQELGLR